MHKRASLAIIAMAIFVLIYNAFLPAHPDETYYWQWGRHLALSYYDGPPLTAYCIRMITGIFGSNAFTLKLTAVLFMLGTCYFMYRLASKMFNARTGWIALIIMLFLPITQAGFVITTLDPTLIFFWTLTLYFFYLAITTEKNHYPYLTAMAIGLTLLAKYSGILLVPALGLFLLLRKRNEFSKASWYVGLVIALLIFSPVIIWNWQLDWAPFSYQYHHGVATQKIFSLELMGSFLGAQMGIANPIFFISAFYYIIRYSKKIGQQSHLLFLTLPFLVTFLFFFYQGMFQPSEANWPAPAYISAVILVSYFIEQHSNRTLFYAITILSIVLMIFIRFPSTTPFLPNNAILKAKFLGYDVLAKQAAAYYQPGDIVASNSIQNASELAFYLPGQPETYILADTHRMYSFWSAPIKQAIHQGKITSTLYIGEPEAIPALQSYFKNVTFITTVHYTSPWVQREWVVYKAWN